MNDTTSATAVAESASTRVHTASSAIKDGVLTFTFGPPSAPTGTLSVSIDDVRASNVVGLADEYVMVGLAMDLRSAYSTARGDGVKARELAEKRLATILAEGRGVVADREGGETSAFTTAVEVMAEHRGKTVEQIMAVINGWTDKPLYKGTDGKITRTATEGAVPATNEDGTPAVYTVADQRREFVARVKADPATMAAYASKRAALLKPKATDAFAEF